MTDCGAIGLSEDTVNSLHGVLPACGAWGRDVTAGYPAPAAENDLGDRGCGDG